jgi:hypothetical protein
MVYRLTRSPPAGKGVYRLTREGYWLREVYWLARVLPADKSTGRREIYRLRISLSRSW